MNFVGGGSLVQYVSQLHQPLQESAVAFYISSHWNMHEKNVVYRNLKLENILLQEDGYIQLSDFGLSAVLRGDARSMSMSGTVTYLAPEVLEGSHDRRVDLWAVDVLAFIMLTLEPPFYSENTAELFTMIRTKFST